MRFSAGTRWNCRPAHNPKHGRPLAWCPWAGGRRETAMSIDSHAVANLAIGGHVRLSPGGSWRLHGSALWFF